MTKEYLKMSDVFCGTITTKLIDDECVTEIVRGDRAWSYHVLEDDAYWMLIEKEQAEYAAHAINSHDELVAEVERLHEFERDAMRYRFLRDNCTTQQADSHGPVFVMTIRQKNNPFNVGLSIDEAMSERKTDE